MITLDAPGREVCTVRRITTNTPLQALVTLNDPAFVEAAQALARRMGKEGGTGVEGRIGHGLELALVRKAEPREVEALAELYRRRLNVYKSDPAAARALANDAAFANNCLLARRLAESGVRFVQLYDWGWDHHGVSPGEDIPNTLPIKVGQIDRALAALVRDLKQRGLLDETLIV